MDNRVTQQIAKAVGTVLKHANNPTSRNPQLYWKHCSKVVAMGRNYAYHFPIFIPKPTLIYFIVITSLNSATIDPQNLSSFLNQLHRFYHLDALMNKATGLGRYFTFLKTSLLITRLNSR